MNTARVGRAVDIADRIKGQTSVGIKPSVPVVFEALKLCSTFLVQALPCLTLASTKTNQGLISKIVPAP
jgi:hypothetical protein